VDKTEPEDKGVLGDQRKRGIQSDMGGAYHSCFIMDMQNPGRSDGICASDNANGKNNAACQRVYPGTTCEQAASS
jgi:hypothetical protein